MKRSDCNLPAKYLPRTLSAVRGQPAAVQTLQAFVAAPTSAAFLFHGPSGVGKTSAAWSLAFDLGCDQAMPWMGGVIDVPSGKQDGGAVDQLLRQLSTRPLFGSGWKVAIVNEADLMTRQAEGIWLDGLEHLPRRTVIAFTSNDLAALSARLVSRCECVPFSGEPAVIGPELERLVRDVWKRETGRKFPGKLPQGLGLFDMAGGTLSFRLALQQIAPYLRTGQPLPDKFQPPIVRDSDVVREAAPRLAALKAVATRRARQSA